MAAWLEFLRNTGQPGGITRHPDGRIDSRLGLQLDGRLSDTGGDLKKPDGMIWPRRANRL